MKLLFDQNLSHKLVAGLSDLFPGSVHVRDFGMAAAEDCSIWEFAKSGEISEDPRTGFDLAWFRQPQLRLPAGHWSIIATFDGYLGACGGERHQVSPAVEVEVVK